jgi:hypothetical protein
LRATGILLAHADREEQTGIGGRQFAGRVGWSRVAD